MKKLLLIILLFSPILSFGQFDVGCILGDCKNGYGIYVWKYTKESVKIEPEIFCYDDDGENYAGEFKDGKRNGTGTYTYRTGAKYVGQWKDGDQDGQGTFTWPSGDKYVGEWKDGAQHGTGAFIKADGTVKEGLWKDGYFTKF